jgi:hypothetical protein
MLTGVLFCFIMLCLTACALGFFAVWVEFNGKAVRHDYRKPRTSYAPKFSNA